jgi:hypothetical protein
MGHYSLPLQFYDNRTSCPVFTCTAVPADGHTTRLRMMVTTESLEVINCGINGGLGQ